MTYLREVLDSDPSRLKEVFLESLKLESLRFALVDEIQLSRDRRSSVSGGGNCFYPLDDSPLSLFCLESPCLLQC